MAAEGKPIIFVTPFSENLKKLKDTINSDEAYSIYEVESAADYAQMAPAVGASLTISSDIKKLAKILSENKKVIKKFNSKVLLLHDQKLTQAVSQKLEKLGLNEVLYEPIVPKTLLYKVSLLCKSLKNPVVKDTSDVVLKSKVEEKKDSETKVDKDQMLTQAAEKKITTENLTKAADQNLDVEALTQKADNKASLSKNLSVKNDTNPIDNNLDMKLSKDKEDLHSETNSKAQTNEELDKITEADEDTPSLGLMEDVADAPKNKKTTIDEVTGPKLKKHVNLAKAEAEAEPTEKNIPDAKAEARKRLREKINNLPSAEREKAEKTLAQLEMMEQKQREALDPVTKEEKQLKKKPLDMNEIPTAEVEKTAQQKLEEKREKLKKLKQMAQEMNTEEDKPAKATALEEMNFDENPDLAALEEAQAEKAAKALREKKIKELQELSRKKNETLAEATEESKEFAAENEEDLPLDEAVAGEEPLEEHTPAAKRKRGEISELKDPREMDKDFDLQLMDDEAAPKEEKSQTEDDENNRKKDYDLELADDEEQPEEEKSNLEKAARKRNQDYDLMLEDEEDKKKKRHIEEEVKGEGFKVKKPELDNNWDYENQGIEDSKEEVVEDGGALDYSEFKEYQESTALGASGMKKKRKTSSEDKTESFDPLSEELATNAEEEFLEAGNGQTSKNENGSEENFDPFAISEELVKKKIKTTDDFTAEASSEETIKKEKKEELLQQEIEMRMEEMIAEKEKELGSAIPEELKKAMKMAAIEEVLKKQAKEYTPEKFEAIKKKMVEIVAEDLYKKEYKESIIEKAESFKKQGKEAKLDLEEKEKNKTMSFDAIKDAVAKMPTVDRPISEEEKTKTKSFYAPDEEKTKTKSFYKEDEPENVIRYGKRGVLNFVKEQPVALVTDEEIILEKPYVPHDTKGLEYIIGVRTLHYLEIFNELRILEFVGNKIMISKNALTTFYFKDPKSNLFELAYSGHKECLESNLYTGCEWEQFEMQNRSQWEQTTLPTWHDPHFKGDQNFFVFPFYEQEAQLGFAIISFLGQVKSEAEGKIVENILSASRCYFLLRYHQALGIEIVDKVAEEVEETIETISIFAKMKSIVKSVWGFFKKAA